MRFLSVLFFSLLTVNSFATQSLDRILVEVNNDIITESELNHRVSEIRRQLAARNASVPPAKMLNKRVLESIIMDKLQLELADRLGIKFDDMSLNAHIETIARNNKMTLSQLRQALLRDNLSYEDFRKQVRSDMIIQRLQKREVFNRIKVSEREIEQMLIRAQQSETQANKYRIGHILITTPEAANSEQLQSARQKAEKVLTRLKQGADFQQSAIQYSEGQHALEGGDLGWRSGSELPGLFLNAVTKLQPGDISPILQSASGFHIIKLTDKQTQQLIIEETHARHILIKVDAITNDESARKQLLKIRKRIVNGEDFAVMAKEHSEDAGSKGNGGDLGWTSKGSFVPQFEKVMDSLQPGQVSEPFKSQFGWHILEVLERRKEDKTDIALRNKAYQTIQAAKADEALQLWLRRLRDEAYISYHNSDENQ